MSELPNTQSDSRPATMNVWFNEYEIGDRFVSRPRTVTETDLVTFSELSGDHSRLHTDAEWASSSTFGQRVAHGLLTLSIASGLEFTLLVSDEDHFLAFYGMDRVRFVKPVFIGDTIRIEFEVKALDRKRPDAGVVTFAAEIRNQRDEVVVVCDKRVLVAAEPSSLNLPPVE